MPPIMVGTSGWNFKSWKQDFYAGLPQRRWLGHCAEHFNALEINGSFYRMPTAAAQERWLAETPDGFPFAVKGHRYLTHYLRLTNAADSIRRQKENLAVLAPRISALLWQLPPRQEKNLERLDGFAASLNKIWPDVPHAMEFRHPSWFDEETADLLSRTGLTNCISDASWWPLWDAITTDIVYVRLHGHERTYASNYTDPELTVWAQRALAWRAEGRTVHVYFDNDAEGWAPKNAVSLLQILAAVSTTAVHPAR